MGELSQKCKNVLYIFCIYCVLEGFLVDPLAANTAEAGKGRQQNLSFSARTVYKTGAEITAY
jgi:hypothetical protein